MFNRIKTYLTSGHRWIVTLVGVVWLISFFLLALPRYRESLRKDHLIDDIAIRIDELSGWNKNLAIQGEDEMTWKTVLDSSYEEYFPKERQVGNVFRQIAGAADRSGVDPIMVQSPGSRSEIPVAPITSGYFEDDYTLNLINRMGQTTDSKPTAITRISPNRLRVRFNSTYTQFVHFMDELTLIPRALSVNSLSVRDSKEGVTVTLEMEYYAQASN
ncbi:MAG: hypothetical protein GY835_25790 [bacterium]|nr:hypothetical protein [bacterium]